MRRVMVALLAAIALGSAGFTDGTRSAAAPVRAAVGDKVSLKGTDPGEALDVTVVKVVDPARAENAFAVPGAGKKFVGVQFRLKNTGTASYSDSPDSSAKVVDGQDQQFTANVAPVSEGPGFPNRTTLAAGDSGLGFVTFEVPRDAKIVKVQFALDGGAAADVGQWTVG